MRSLALKTLNYFLCGYLKDNVYATQPKEIDESRVVIKRERAQILIEMFLSVCDSIVISLATSVDKKLNPDCKLY